MSPTSNVILLAEDSPADTKLILRAFKLAKIANPIQVVKDGQEAVDYLAGTGHFDNRYRFPQPILLLLDLKMPKRSGFSVLSWIRQESANPGLPVVVLTSSKERRDVNQAYDLGANSYLCKPVDGDSLLSMVSALNLYWLVLSELPT